MTNTNRVTPVLIGLLLSLATAVRAGETPDEAATFKMKEVSVRLLKSGNPDLRGINMGSPVRLVNLHAKNAKLVSKKVLRGTLVIRGTAGPAADKHSATGTRPSEQGSEYCFFLDETKGTGKGYDRMYFDRDGDGDPMNDPPIAAVADPPKGGASRKGPCFEALTIKAHKGVADQNLTLTANMKGQSNVIRFAPTTVRMGTIRLGKRDYEAVLGSSFRLNWRLNDPQDTALTLIRLGPKGRLMEFWWGSNSLKQMRCVDGQWYSFTASASGDELTVHRYAGDLGVLRFGPGNRDIKNVAGYGSLEACDHTVRVARPRNDEGETTTAPPAKVRSGPDTPIRTEYFGTKDKTESVSLPAGDYLPRLIHVRMGRLMIEVSNNYHADGQPRGSSADSRVYGIRIAKDKPFVLDFSNTPSVMFANPAKAAVLRPGEELRVAAVLIDPKIDIMIRGLDDMTRKQIRKLSNLPSYEAPLSLDPTVTITDSSGNQVAGGPMPFG